MLHRLKAPVHCGMVNQIHKLGRAPQLGQNHPKGLYADHVKGFRQVFKDCNEVHILFDALFHILFDGLYYVR